MEEFDEALERELVHVVHLHQVAEDHEEIRPNHCEVSIDITLLIEGDLKLLGLLQSAFNRATLSLGLIQVIDQLLILEDVAC
jgi:hypothetical protein